jgi:nicotinate-nucleotide pyrophosphorylase (carboxylating)
MHEPDRKSYQMLIELAKREDFGGGDVTSEVTIPAGRQGQTAIAFREAGVLCGMMVVEEVLRQYDAKLRLERIVNDGEKAKAGTVVGRISGPLRSLLAAERIVLNFLQRLSGIATVTAGYVEATAGTRAKICDTRKTTPGWRELEKYAVRCGGAVNHRQGLYDAVLIKDNHLAVLGEANLVAGLKKAMENIRRRVEKPAFVEVEVDTLEQLRQVLTVEGVDMILLDNMTPVQLAEAVQIRDEHDMTGTILLEASGGINMSTVRAIAESGADRISVGALTHQIRSLDIGLDME